MGSSETQTLDMIANEQEWPGKDEGQWSPEAQALRRKFFAEFRKSFGAHIKRLDAREEAAAKRRWKDLDK